MSQCPRTARLAVAFDLGQSAKYAAVRRQPRRAAGIVSVLVGNAGAVSSYSGTSWDAAHVLSCRLRRDQDGAFFFRGNDKRGRRGGER